MKSITAAAVKAEEESRPARGAWIEIVVCSHVPVMYLPSRPARGAWIEICDVCACSTLYRVAPRKGRVD